MLINHVVFAGVVVALAHGKSRHFIHFIINLTIYFIINLTIYFIINLTIYFIIYFTIYFIIYFTIYSILFYNSIHWKSQFEFTFKLLIDFIYNKLN